MKRMLLVLCAVSTTCLIAWLASENSGKPIADAPRTGSSAPPTPHVEEPALEEPHPQLVEPRLDAAAPVNNSELTEELKTRVIGRVVDARGHGIANLDLTLSAHGEAWADAFSAPALPPSPWASRSGYSASTAADGSFEFEVKTPSAVIRFQASTNPFQDQLGLLFGGNYTGSQAPLHAGDNNLGTLTVQDTGTVSGHLQDSEGQPIQHAIVRIDEFFNNTGRETRELVNGDFTIEHVPPGNFRLEVIADGFLMMNRSGVEVRAGQATTQIDFQLERAPSISGSIEDQDGKPLGNVFITGWPVSSGRSSSTRSTADGSFEVFLAQNEAHKFQLTLAGYEDPNGFMGDTSYDPGNRDAKLMLRKLAETTFIVLDSETEQPIERYGLSIGLQYAPRTEQHEAGRTVRKVEPGGPGYCLYAPGYARQSGDVVYDDEGASVQTLRLQRGGSISGTVTHSGQPSEFPSVQVAAARHKLDPSTPDLSEKERMWSDAYGFDMGRFEGYKRIHRGLEDGAFRLEDLTPGTYTIVIRPNDGAAITRELIRVQAGETVELGVLEAPPAAILRGTLLFAHDISPLGLQIELRGPETREETLADAQGEFEFEGLAAGTYSLNVNAKPRVLTRGDEILIALGVGEVKEMQLDLTDRAPCRVSLHVTFNGRPAVEVTARARDSRTANTNHFGETDDSGMLVADLSALGERTIELFSPAGFRLGAFPDVHDFAPGKQITLSTDLSPGELELHLPEITETELNYPRLELIYPGGYHEPASIPFTLKHLRNDTFDWSTRTIQLGPIAPGTYGVRLQLDSERAFIGQAVVSESELTTCELALE